MKCLNAWKSINTFRSISWQDTTSLLPIFITSGGVTTCYVEPFVAALFFVIVLPKFHWVFIFTYRQLKNKFKVITTNSQLVKVPLSNLVHKAVLLFPHIQHNISLQLFPSWLFFWHVFHHMEYLASCNIYMWSLMLGLSNSE